MTVKNPWLAADYEAAGVRFAMPDFGWVFWLRPGTGVGRTYARTMERLLAQPQFAAYAERRRAADYVETPDDAATVHDFLCALAAEALIVRWEGVTDRDGQPLTLTPDNALIVVTQLQDVRERIVAFCQNAENFPLTVEQTAGIVAGNSQPVLNTSQVAGATVSKRRQSAKRGAKARRA
jgi:hypothetical protein